MQHNRHRRKWIFMLLTAVLPAMSLFGQFNTYSPYTRFGLGDLARAGFSQNLAMGGTGLAIHEDNRINYLNPASFSSLDSNSVYFDFGANAYYNSYSTTQFSRNWWNMNFHHMAFATSAGKFVGLSAGIVPYSSVGYNIKQEYNDWASGEALDTYYRGDGGIMNFYAGGSLKLFNRISVGVTMNYLIGRITREREVEYPMNSTYASLASTELVNLRKPMYSLGLQYRELIGDRFFISVGGVYDLKASIRAQVQNNSYNLFYPLDTISLGEDQVIDPRYPVVEDTSQMQITIPAKRGLGVALGIPDKLILTGDYYMQDWSGSMSGEKFRTTRSTSMHFGAEFTPDVNALRGFHNFISYRVGLYYSNYYLEVNENQLEDFGITFGAGIPIRSLRSSINVAFTLGTRGTTEYNLVKENYGIFTFNVTLHDLWFLKRRFD